MSTPAPAPAATPFMSITPIKSGEPDALRTYLRSLSQASPFARVAATHFARWVVFDDWVNDPAQPHEDHLQASHLIFSSNFTGPADAYLDVLCGELAPEAPQIWGRCVGAPEPPVGAALKAYLLAHEIKAGFFVAAYPNASVDQVRSALAQRAWLIDLAVRAEQMSAEQVRDAFAAGPAA